MATSKFKKYMNTAALLLLMGSTAYGQVPSTNDTSDANGNTGMGTLALNSNTSGFLNTASGFQALFNNTSGWENTASGIDTLYFNTTGYQNTASGAVALNANTTGHQNTAIGSGALPLNTTGSYNTASGIDSLSQNATGDANTASGADALNRNTTGSANTANGQQALYSNTTGNRNIALGAQAGANLTIGDNNIDIGNPGVAGESGKIRIGTTGQQSNTFIAGIWGSRITPGLPVFVNSSGELGVVPSSERYKTDITPMGSTSERLLQLQPVTFHLKTDPTGNLQFGLIAEEVASVYPELVIRDEKGTIEGVRYDELAPILLNEVQQQRKQIAALEEQMGTLKAQQTQIEALRAEVAQLHDRAAGLIAVTERDPNTDEVSHRVAMLH